MDATTVPRLEYPLGAPSDPKETMQSLGFRSSGTGSIDTGAAVRQLMSASHSSSMKLDDGVVPELVVASVVDLEVHRRILAGTPISPGALNPNMGVCTKSGGCGGRGNPYSVRGCNRYNFCPPM
uniref:Uncharacterized protein n=1 Tax=Aegilops tauschii TaxID=37682 RepID=R7VZF0_AEGTA